MSIQNVKAFYENLSQDEVFREQVKNAKGKDDWNHKVKAAGYDFTSEEFEHYTAKLLEKNINIGNDLEKIGEREFEAVYGGFVIEGVQIYGMPTYDRL